MWRTTTILPKSHTSVSLLTQWHGTGKSGGVFKWVFYVKLFQKGGMKKVQKAVTGVADTRGGIRKVAQRA